MNELFFNGQTGWICPKCGQVWAPLMTECVPCNDPLVKAVGLIGNRAMEQTLEHIRNHPPFTQSVRESV
jgi:uncharacterized OB-fold protein